jgi:8-oxo-dGTP pyrophosphatase MutT (NUDIX family)
MANTTQKIAAYITRERDGRIELLVFNHPEADYFTRDAPKPWFQLPAGTGEPGETARQAAIREVFEESGLSAFEAIDFIGAYDDQPWGIRHVYHMRVAGAPPDHWVHVVESDGGWDHGMVFHYEWIPLATAAPQIGMFDKWLPLVVAAVNKEPAQHALPDTAASGAQL